jgi:hypothetical protein
MHERRHHLLLADKERTGREEQASTCATDARAMRAVAEIPPRAIIRKSPMAASVMIEPSTK